MSLKCKSKPPSQGGRCLCLKFVSEAILVGRNFKAAILAAANRGNSECSPGFLRIIFSRLQYNKC